MTLTPEQWETTTRAIKKALITELSRLCEKHSFEQPKRKDFFGAFMSFDKHGDLNVHASFEDSTFPAIYPNDDRIKDRIEAVGALLHCDPQQIAFVTEELLRRIA